MRTAPKLRRIATLIVEAALAATGAAALVSPYSHPAAPAPQRDIDITKTATVMMTTPATPTAVIVTANIAAATTIISARLSLRPTKRTRSVVDTPRPWPFGRSTPCREYLAHANEICHQTRKRYTITALGLFRGAMEVVIPSAVAYRMNRRA